MGKRAQGECPNCALPIPLAKTFWSLGKPFACKGCGATIAIEKRTAAQTGIAIGILVVAKFLGLGLALLCGLFAQMAAWKTSRVDLIAEPPTTGPA